MDHTPPAAASAALTTFREKFFGPIDQYLAWHDGFEDFTDLGALDRLSAAERAVAEQELIAGLQAPRGADTRAVIGLGHLRSRAALPVLHALLPAAGAYALPAIAQIDAQAMNWSRLEALLRSPLSEYQLLDLLVGLRQAFTLAQMPPAVPAAVLDLLLHPDYLVRFHALATLRTLYALLVPEDVGLRADYVFNLICSDKSAGQRREAQRLVREQIRALGYSS